MKFRIVPSADSKWPFDLYEVKTSTRTRGFWYGRVTETYTYDSFIKSGSFGELEELAQHLCTAPKEISCSQSQ